MEIKCNVLIFVVNLARGIINSSDLVQTAETKWSKKQNEGPANYDTSSNSTQF